MNIIKKAYKSQAFSKLSNCTSPSIKVAVLKLARLSRYSPAIELRLAHYLVQQNQAEQASEILHKLNSFLASSQVLPTIDRQATQFSIESILHAIGKPLHNDALCRVSIQKKDPSTTLVTQPAGNYKVNTKFSGIEIAGKIQLHTEAGVTHPEKVQLLLNGQLIREESTAVKDDKAYFRITIKRPAVNLMPADSLLQVQTTTGKTLICGNAEAVNLTIPHGNNQLFEQIAHRGALTKKGHLPLTPEEVYATQNQYLKLYTKVNEAFIKITGRPMFLLYGTLLGLYRDGDFIPGDDDFDIGHVSLQTDPISVKRETIDIMLQLISAGFTIAINRRGKPFRIRHPEVDAQLHLDGRPVWQQNGKIWMHKQACLSLKLEDFLQTEQRKMRGTDVTIPSGTEDFLRAYYGKGWKYPDPSFSNSSVTVPREVKQNLAQICLTHRELEVLSVKARELKKDQPHAGEFIPIAQHDLYPLDEYTSKCGW
ncbi:LicD family protein [Desulfurispira natronophila]|uniref:LicD/FKTN/FKRP nucleotidyltransferase domain-containing protein n=1 Tax=Desulfurispira natronophila TaxID=682562 RepID=A0A7W7Y6W6_9BACT|nr:LicD family protein [Desulfurispira natronophila]MBB5022842.1 hypothetical protein [Desulfurispira natronophila]